MGTYAYSIAPDEMPLNSRTSGAILFAYMNSIEFHGYKKDNFQMKMCDVFLILLKTLIVGALIEAVLTSTHNLCFRAKIRKK